MESITWIKSCWIIQGQVCDYGFSNQSSVVPLSNRIPNTYCLVTCLDCDSIRGQWSAFEEMHAQKLTKSISVSNFNSNQLDCVLQTAKVKPVVNQLPYSVAYHPGDVIAENNKREILVQAWAPLGGSLGGRFDKNIKSACAKIGKNYGKSFAQVGSLIKGWLLFGFDLEITTTHRIFLFLARLPFVGSYKVGEVSQPSPRTRITSPKISRSLTLNLPTKR